MYEVQKILNWFNQFDKINIQIKSKTIEFNISLNKYSVPHLLGLHYMFANKTSGVIIRKNILDNNLSDEYILEEVKKNNSDKVLAVSNRIYTFKEFLENLETGIIVEQTKEKTNINSNYFIIKLKDKAISHLGICKTEVEDCLEIFEVKPQNDAYWETYIVQYNNKYFSKSNIFDKVEHIYKYNEKLEKFENFTFKGKDIEYPKVAHYETGQLKEVAQLKNGLLHGETKRYYKNGQLKQVVQFKDGLLHGETKIYYENGQLQTHGEYSNNLRVGQWENYNINGKIMSITTYKDGSLLHAKKFDGNGSNGIIGERMYKATEVKNKESELTIFQKNKLTISKKNKLIIPKKNKNKEENER